MMVIQNTLYSLFGPQPFFYHLFQVAFHIVAAVLLFYLFKRFFKESIAFFLSLLFLVHPANVEAVCFASAMQEVLFTFTGILALYLLVRSKEISIISIIIATTLSAAALLMKETGIVFFGLIFIYLIIFHRKNMDVIQLYVAFSIIVLFTYGMARFGSGNTYVQSQGLFPIMRVSLPVRLMNIPLITLHYLGTFFVPFHLAIAQHWVVYSPSLGLFILPLIVCISIFIAAIAYILKTRNRTFMFFFLWFLFGLLPHLQFVPLNMTVAERWMYFSMIGLVGMGGAVLTRFKVYNSQFRIAAILIISLFFIRSFSRTLDWRDGLILYSSNISSTSSFDLQNNMGVELFRIGRYKEAKRYFEKSTQLAPYWWVNWNNLGAAYEKEQNYPKAKECYERAVQNGVYILAYENLAKIHVIHGTDKKKTEDFLNKALQMFPENKNIRGIQAYYVQQLRGKN